MEYTYLARLLEEGRVDILKNLLKDNLTLLDELKNIQPKSDSLSSLPLPLVNVNINPNSSSSLISTQAINATTPMVHNTLINRAIMMTKDVELIELLIKNGADIYQHNTYYQNAISLSLSLASENKKYRPILDCIMSYVPLNLSLKLNSIENKYYNLAMLYSAFCFESDAIDSLNKGLAPYEKYKENNILVLATEREQFDLINFVLKKYSEEELNLPTQEEEVNYYFLIACAQNNLELCHLFIDHTLISSKTLEHAKFLQNIQDEVNELISLMSEKACLENKIQIENDEIKKRTKL